MDWKNRITRLFSGGSAELGRPDIVRQVVEGILALRTYGAHGEELFPGAVTVRIEVAEGSVEVVRLLVEEPAFDHEIEVQVLNRLTRAESARLPLRRCTVTAADRNAVKVAEDPTGLAARLRVRGGDRDGHVLPLPATRREFRMGRGAWHGRDQQGINDIVLTESLPYVSRAAAVLRRSGTLFEIETRDQGECLVVERPDQTRIRPARVATGRTLVRPGDTLHFTDGKDQEILVIMEDECLS